MTALICRRKSGQSPLKAALLIMAPLAACYPGFGDNSPWIDADDDQVEPRLYTRENARKIAVSGSCNLRDNGGYPTYQMF